MYDDEQISLNEIIKLFKVTRISVNLDGSESLVVKKNSQLCDATIIPSDVIIDQYLNEFNKKEKEEIKEKANLKNIQTQITNFYPVKKTEDTNKNDQDDKNYI